VVIAQINRGVGDEMRPRIFGAIAYGARGIGFWRDSYDPAGMPSDPLRVENRDWWGDFPSISSEIDQMLAAGLIQVPHWTEWSIDTDEDLISAHATSTAKAILLPPTTTTSLRWLPSRLTIWGFLATRQQRSATFLPMPSCNQFDITLGANGSGVFRLVAPTNLGDYDGDTDADGADFLVWQRGGSPGDLAGDLAAWESAYGAGAGPLVAGVAAQTAVPEPSTALLAGIVGLLLVGGRSRRRVS